MKYFAMIGDRQVGPFELDDVVKEGVRPDTYVWCKGMPDWAMAKDVPDICRYFRLRLSGALPAQRMEMHTDADRMAADNMEQEELLQQFNPRLRHYIRKSGIRLSKENLPQPHEGPSMRVLPIVLYIVCILLIIAGILIM